MIWFKLSTHDLFLFWIVQVTPEVELVFVKLLTFNPIVFVGIHNFEHCLGSARIPVTCCHDDPILSRLIVLSWLVSTTSKKALFGLNIKRSSSWCTQKL